MDPNDSALFLSAEDLRSEGATKRGGGLVSEKGRWLRLYEGKAVHHFDHRWLFEDTRAEREDAMSLSEPAFFVAESEVLTRTADRWHAGFRNVAPPTNERSIIAGIIPLSGATNSFPILRTNSRRKYLLVASLQSLVVDFCARQKIGGSNINFFLVKQLPVLTPEQFDKGLTCVDDLIHWLTDRVVELTYTAWDLGDFAQDLGLDHPPMRWDSERRPLLRAELDACFFHLYAIERDDVDYIMETFPIVKRKDEAAFGEYRTKRLILEVYDAMAKAIASDKPYETILDPPPADPSLCHPESTRPDWALRA